jgi:hypothetical protein
MFDQLSALAWGLVAFAVIVGVGTLVLVKLSVSLGQADNHNNSADTGQANATTDYLMKQLGTSGLSGWAPALIAVSIGALILGLFMGSRGRKY